MKNCTCFAPDKDKPCECDPATEENSAVKRMVMFAERWAMTIFIGAVLMILAGLAEKYWTDFYPWNFVAGGIWIKYCDYRKRT